MRFCCCHDGDDAHDAHLRKFSRCRGAPLLRRLFALFSDPTNPTSEPERCIPMRFMSPSSVSGYQDRPRTRHLNPTTDHHYCRACRNIVGSQTHNPTTRNPLLTPNTRAIVGFVGFCERYENSYSATFGRTRLSGR
jgi:hypothetical protein